MHPLPSFSRLLCSYKYVLNLTEVKPHEFVRYGLLCLETFAANGDESAREWRELIQIMQAQKKHKYDGVEP